MPERAWQERARPSWVAALSSPRRREGTRFWAGGPGQERAGAAPQRARVGAAGGGMLPTYVEGGEAADGQVLLVVFGVGEDTLLSLATGGGARRAGRDPRSRDAGMLMGRNGAGGGPYLAHGGEVVGRALVRSVCAHPWPRALVTTQSPRARARTRTEVELSGGVVRLVDRGQVEDGIRGRQRDLLLGGPNGAS